MTSRTPSDFGQELLVYLDSLYSLAMVFAKNKETAEELVQQTCLKALENFQRFQQNTNLKAWLFTILRNLWLNHHRNTKFFVVLDEEVIVQDRRIDLDRNLMHKEIRSAILSMPVLHREILLMRDIEGLSYQEISFVLSCPLGTVMSRINRARSLLKDILSGVTKRENAEL